MCDVEDECIQVDHLELKSGHENDNLKWVHPSHDDIQVVNPIQVLPCDVDGEGESRQQPVYVINNAAALEVLYEENA